MDTKKKVDGNLAEREIQHNDSLMKILVTPTNEEKQIALETLELLHEES